MKPARPQILVLGPVYLDLVLEVDRPLSPRMPGVAEGAADRPDRDVLDHSVYETQRSRKPSDRLIVRSEAGETIEIVGTSAATLPLTGTVTVDRRFMGTEAWHHRVELTAHRRLPGGMGSGFAAALKSRVVAALGANDEHEPDAEGQTLIERLREVGADLTPQLIAGIDTDTTVLISSGPHGDKLPIGRRRAGGMFRCDAALKVQIDRAEVLVFAGLHNRLTAQLLRATARDDFVVFAPTWRNIGAEICELAPVADQIDYLSCNEQEWRELDGDSWLREQVALITVTAGTEGMTLFYRDQSGKVGTVRMPAFRPGDRPVDTNRAGESFATAFLNCLLEEAGVDGLKSRRVARELLEHAAREATVAAHLQVQTRTFQFHDRDRIRAEIPH